MVRLAEVQGISEDERDTPSDNLVVILENNLEANGTYLVVAYH
jgi:hypothetical protein